MSTEVLCSYDFSTVITLMEHLLHAISRIHSKGIIHGDVKPGNIMRVEEAYSVIDFDGSSREHEVLPAKYSTAYAPVERLSNSSLVANKTVDTW